MTPHREREGDGLISATTREVGIPRDLQQIRETENLHSTASKGAHLDVDRDRSQKDVEVIEFVEL